MQSLWNETANRPQFPEQSKNEQTDVLIVGGGITGILCAYHLQRSGIACMLVEGDVLCSRTTAGTTAKITVQHGLIYARIRKDYGDAAAPHY